MDRTIAHDIRNSVMVIRSLSILLHEGKLKDDEREQAYKHIADECNKLLELSK